jgi:VanZ family protein
MGLIFFLSHQDKAASRETSGLFLLIFEWLGYTKEELEAWYLPGLVRKLAHMGVYFVLFFWSYRLDRRYWPQASWPYRALLWGLLYAISDEVHQIYVPGRGPHVLDVLIDMVGALLSWGAIRLYGKKYISRSVDQRL